jgi:hypothetical protein
MPYHRRRSAIVSAVALLSSLVGTG